jgi:pimeloyl-ACP methyl ester carboxylesterase
MVVFKRLMKWLRVGLVVAASSVAVFVGISGAVVWKLTGRQRAPYVELPPNVPMAVESLRLTTRDGFETGAWFVAGTSPNPCILVLHGNGGSRSVMRPLFVRLAQEQYCVLAMSLRAHGDSSGESNDFGFSAGADVDVAVKFLEVAQPQRKIFVVGRSLGAAAAVFAARDLESRIAGYFLEQPYRDLESAVTNRLRMRMPHPLAALAYQGMRLWSGVFLPVAIGEISLEARARDIPPEIPVVIIAGSADRHATVSDVSAIAETMRGHCELVVFDGAEHQALDEYDPALYSKSLNGLLGRP